MIHHDFDLNTDTRVTDPAKAAEPVTLLSRTIKQQLFQLLRVNFHPPPTQHQFGH